MNHLTGFLRFAIWTNSHYDGVPVGQMGGLPRLPEGMPWPACGSMPLPFIASFDCAALPRVDDLPLPADGSLLFFLHHDRAYDEREELEKDDEMAYARVVYVPAGTPMVTAQEPDHPEEVFYNTTLPFIGDEYPLAAAVKADLPSWLGDDDRGTPTASLSDDDHLGVRLPHKAQLRDLAEKLWPEWVTLAQFLPEHVYRARFLIRRDDLAAGRFDQTLSHTAFTE